MKRLKFNTEERRKGWWGRNTRWTLQSVLPQWNVCVFWSTRYGFSNCSSKRNGFIYCSIISAEIHALVFDLSVNKVGGKGTNLRWFSHGKSTVAFGISPHSGISAGGYPGQFGLGSKLFRLGLPASLKLSPELTPDPFDEISFENLESCLNRPLLKHNIENYCFQPNSYMQPNVICKADASLIFLCWVMCSHVRIHEQNPQDFPQNREWRDLFMPVTRFILRIPSYRISPP